MNDVKLGLFGRAVDVMGKSLNLRLAKHSMTAANLANMDVPGYRMRDLNFEQTLQQTIDPPDGKMVLRRTHVNHVPVQNVKRAYQAAESTVEYSMYGRDENGNDLVDIDQEMTKLAKNHLVYNATVQMLAKEFENLKYAITEGGR